MEEYDEEMMKELAEAEAEFVKTYGECPSEFQFASNWRHLSQSLYLC